MYFINTDVMIVIRKRFVRPQFKILTEQRSLAMLMIVSPSVMRLFRLVSHTLRHSLRSGAAGCRCGAAAGALPPTQRHSASPVAPPGHGCALKSPTCVQFQYKPRADVGGHSSPRSTFSPCPLIPIASPIINTMIKCYANSQVNKTSFK